MTAFHDVEDNLAALAILSDGANVQNAAVKSVQRAVALATNRYTGGAASDLDVVIALSYVPGSERAALDIARRRMAASVRPIKVLGGGWKLSNLPAGDAALVGFSAGAAR